MMDQMMAPVSLFDIWGQIIRIATTLQVMWHVLPFMYRAWPGNAACNNASLDYARKVKADLSPGEKLGAAGFCWGGCQSLRVSAHPAVEGGSERLIDAQFCAHPSGIKLPDDIVNAVTKFKTPVVVAHAGNDHYISLKQIEESKAALRQRAGNGNGENGFNYEVKIYEGVGHGFSVRAAPGSKREEVAADEAKEQAIAWFKKWL
jgi:dienelactone hydrolase